MIDCFGKPLIGPVNTLLTTDVVDFGEISSRFYDKKKKNRDLTYLLLTALKVPLLGLCNTLVTNVGIYCREITIRFNDFK